jgi:hypothetical protein
MLTPTHAPQEIPLACDLTAIPAEQRPAHELLARQLFFEAIPERQELSDGYTFQFRADQYPLLAAFIANERLCCPFFSFTLEVTPAQGPLWLRLTGGDGVKEFIHAEFPKEER